MITGNWGTDLALLIKAAKDANLEADFYTYYASTTGTPTAMGAAGAEKVKAIGYWNVNSQKFVPKDEYELGEKLHNEFKNKYKEDFYVIATFTGLRLLSGGFNKANSTDPIKVAAAMEGMKFKSLNGEVEMRKTDHQLQQALFVTTWTKVDGKDVKYDMENTGHGFRTEVRLDPFVASQPTSCQMKRPSAS